MTSLSRAQGIPHHLLPSEDELENAARVCRNWREECWAHCYAGELARKRRQWKEAKQQFEESRLLAEQVQDDLCLGTMLSRRAEIAEARGDLYQAERLYRQALVLHS